MNKVFLIGRLTKKPEIRYTETEKAIVTFTLAVDNPKGDADFIQIQAWNKIAELCSKYLDKGSQVAVDGSIRTDNYTDKDGNKRYTTYVICSNVQFLSQNKGEKVQDNTNTLVEQNEPDFSQLNVKTERQSMFTEEDMPF